MNEFIFAACTNNCSVACCNCNIEVNPPVCVANESKTAQTENIKITLKQSF